VSEKEQNVFEGPTDGRQGDASVKPSRFRPRYRALSEEEKAVHDEIKSTAEELLAAFDKAHKPTNSWYYTLAVTALEEAVMWMVKGLTL